MIERDSYPERITRIDDQDFYKIENSHLMAPFFMTLVSAEDHWMFVASNGALTAGRRCSSNALFPYYSADKIVDLQETTGPLTVIQLATDQGTENWTPFRHTNSDEVTQNLYKSDSGATIVFEEFNHKLGVRFRYRWQAGQRFGFIRSCQLSNLNDHPLQLRILDGLCNLLPSGIDPEFQRRYSNLGDAYKRNERVADTPLALFYLNSIPTDRAEPSEGLRASVVWQQGMTQPTILLSTRQLDHFKAGQPIQEEREIRGQRGAYLVSQSVSLPPGTNSEWKIVADVQHDQADVTRLLENLTETNLAEQVADDIQANENRLTHIISAADGIQCGQSPEFLMRHRANVTFNIMRGGIPVDGYQIPVPALADHIQQNNRLVDHHWRSSLLALGDQVEMGQLLQWAIDCQDPDLTRIVREYLPLCFSRRHGDPTRPWNEFEINTRHPDGSLKIDYQGNWRDIFQNWEALGLSFPRYFVSMLFRFANASTIDGHNPYRLTRDGFDWEKPSPGDSWSNIGYWGDHQIIYQLKLMEQTRRFLPAQLDSLLHERNCVFADVPYRIVSYRQMLENSRDSIRYDLTAESKIDARVEQLGSDGKLCHRGDEMVRVSLFEKILLSGVVKLANLIPDAGIWLNTQRPEWNDANNALVGIGSSVVTTCYLRRFFDFLQKWLQGMDTAFELTSEIADLLDAVTQILNDPKLTQSLDDVDRRGIVDQLQQASEHYRNQVYGSGLGSETRSYLSQDLAQTFDRFVQILDQTIDANRRDDGLYHAYNLVRFDENQVSISRLDEMLEGQVAVLSSGRLTPTEAVRLLQALRVSQLYREDQHSYLLYPNRDLPGFMDKNLVDSASVPTSSLLSVLLDRKDDSIVKVDTNGNIRFNGQLRNSSDVADALARLKTRFPELSEQVDHESDKICSLFESTFDHDRFTGRSGSFFGYEGLGCIYWHMVSKLAVAVQENFMLASQLGDSDATASLARAYFDVHEGLGIRKTPQHYGAFPTDPYSHTPEHAGAQQPGMTGQAKEDILTRLTEVGVRVENGRLSFDLQLFRNEELTRVGRSFDYVDAWGQEQTVQLQPGQFAYTFCQVPIIYSHGGKMSLTVQYADGSTSTLDGLSLSVEESGEVFQRTGKLRQIYLESPVLTAAAHGSDDRTEHVSGPDHYQAQPGPSNEAQTVQP